MHHTISGARPLFQLVASSRARTFPSEVVRSAEMRWKRWEDGFGANACILNVSKVRMRGGGRPYSYFLQRSLEFWDVARDNNNISPFR